MTTEVVAQVSGHCWQYKLCYIQCPFTPDEGAYEAPPERDRMLVLLAVSRTSSPCSSTVSACPCATRHAARAAIARQPCILTFSLGERLAGLARTLRAPIALSVVHPQYCASTPLSVAALNELAVDLA